jgi:hypothetical protein
MTWGWPQWTYVGMTAFTMLYVAVKHGEPKTDKYDIGWTTLAVVLSQWILWCGGFYA